MTHPCCLTVGGNLGVVTSFTVKTNSLATIPTVTTMKLSWNYENSAKVFDTVRPYIHKTMVLLSSGQ